jgi:hypothetical protein
MRAGWSRFDAGLSVDQMQERPGLVALGVLSSTAPQQGTTTRTRAGGSNSHERQSAHPLIRR